MNKVNAFTKKHRINYPDGANAMLVYARNQIKKISAYATNYNKPVVTYTEEGRFNIIEDYKPSQKYLDHINMLKIKIKQIHDVKLHAPYFLRRPIADFEAFIASKNLHHTYHANRLFDHLVQAGKLNPELDDICLEIDFDTPVVLPAGYAELHDLKPLKKVEVQWRHATLG